jgi:hypothetical protein
MSTKRIIRLSVNPTNVITKEDGEKITNFIVREYDLDDPNIENELRLLCRSNVHSVNNWIGECSPHKQKLGYTGHSCKSAFSGVWGLALDYDDGKLSLEEAKEKYKDFIHIIYTSSGHRQGKPDHGGVQDRFRVILPFALDTDGNAKFKDSGASYYRYLKRLYPEADPKVFDKHMKLYPFCGSDQSLYEFYLNKDGKWFSVDPDSYQIVNDPPDSNPKSDSPQVSFSIPEFTIDDLERIKGNCPVINNAFTSITENKDNENTPGHYKRLAVASMIKHTIDDEDYLLDLFSHTSDFKKDRTLYHYRSLTKGAITCQKLQEWKLCPGPCQAIMEIDKKSPIAFADPKNIPLDIAGEIECFNQIKDPLEKANVIEKFISQTVIKQSPLKQDAIIKEIGKNCKLGISSLRDTLRKVDSNEEIDYSQPLNKLLLGNTQPVSQGRIAFEWFKKNGGKYYRDKENVGYLYYDDEIYKILPDYIPFTSLMLKLGNITNKTTTGKVIIEVLKNLAYEKGGQIGQFSWQYTDLINNEIYLTLNNESKELLKIEAGSVEVVKNGNNAKSIILQGSNKMKPINYTELDDENRFKVFANIKKYVFNNLACAPSDRYFYLSWALTYPLIGYFKTVPHMRGEGSSTCGKSRSMDVIGHLIYGDTVLKKGTTASYYTDGSLNPLIQMDNIETENLTTGLEDFIITAVTGIEKEKRKLGTDRENVIEKVKTLINTTGIEGLKKTEMINRTFVINFDHYEFGNPEWNELIYVDIVKHRDLMLSAIFQMISGVLKRIENGELYSIVKMLSKKYPNHSKSRANSYLACMIMIAEQLIEYFNDSITIDDLIESWINSQNILSSENTSGTNPIVLLLDSLVKDYKMELDKSVILGTRGKFINPYPVEIADLGLDCVIKGTANELNTAFSILAKKTGRKNPYTNAHQLASRLKDSKNILGENGWMFTSADIGSRKRIYTITWCETVKPKIEVSQGISQK